MHESDANLHSSTSASSGGPPRQKQKRRHTHRKQQERSATTSTSLHPPPLPQSEQQLAPVNNSRSRAWPRKSTSAGAGPTGGLIDVGVRGFATLSASQLPPSQVAQSTFVRKQSDFARRSQEMAPSRSNVNASAAETLDDIELRYAPPSSSASAPVASTSAPPAASDGPKRKRKQTKRKKPKVIEEEKEAAPEENEQPSSEDESGPMLEAISEGTLEDQILRLFNTQRASPQALEARSLLIERLEKIFNGHRFRWGHAHDSRFNRLRVEPFGSVRFGLSTANSDLDLCLIDPYHPNGFDHKQYRNGDVKDSPAMSGIYDMQQVARALHNASRDYGFTKILPIPFANVPIVKFEAVVDGTIIQVDINTNNQFGVLNSSLIAAYSKLHPLFRPLCVFIKFYFRQRQLNDPSGSKGGVTLSSYTLILLVIAYLQQLSVLPNLQSSEIIEAAGVKRRRFWSNPRQKLSPSKTAGPRQARVTPSVGWDTTFVEAIPESFDWSPAEVEGGLVELATGFFEYYGNTLDMETEAVSIANGGTVKRERSFQDKLSKQAKKLELEEAMALLVTGEKAEGEGAVEAVADGVDPTAAFSRSSSPIEYDQFEEPKVWKSQMLVVQDPFILERNTAVNISVEVALIFREELRRAARMIKEGASLGQICSSKKHEPEYKSLSQLRRLERNKRQKNIEVQQAKLQKLVSKGSSLSGSSVAGQPISQDTKEAEGVLEDDGQPNEVIEPLLA